MRTTAGPRTHGLVVTVAVALVVAACGSSSPSAAITPSSAPPSASASAPASSVATSASPGTSPSAAAAACGTYAGPPAQIAYAMWGDTTELANQQKIVDAFQQLNPNIKVKVSVADWDSYW